ncbi:MAG TPA: SpoIIE family protein phosphatase [Isosphaeraceae bacterium]|nr:SpoIIE family protein phosphatase [Isosphaeraceae bacterium]
MTRPHAQSLAVIIDEPTKVGEARRRATALAAALGFDALRQGTVALVVSEAATNLIKHAGGGELIVLGRDDPATGSRLELLALDRGPGMTDVGRCLADGYSTAGSLGNGLGAIRRLSDSLEIYSSPGGGTVLWARLGARCAAEAARGTALEFTAVSLPAPRQDVCGDNWAVLRCGDQSLVLLVDGLGHGAPAAEAAEAAVRVFRSQPAGEPAAVIEAAHRALRGTRGAALAIARLDSRRGAVRYAGVGNIAGLLLDSRTGQTIRMISENGTVGHAVRKIQAFDYPWAEDAVVILHSDGLATRWDLDNYPGLSRRHPALLAGLLYRDHRRGRDDVSVLVARREGTAP